MKRASNPRSGFTLVEVILSLLLTSLILAALYGCYAAGIRAWRAGMVRADLSQNARVVLDTMTRDLEAAFLSPNGFGTRFVGRNIVDEELGRDLDELTFIAINNDPYLGVNGQSDLQEIQYYIDTDPETPALWLVRRADPTPDNDPFTGGRSSLLGVRVISLDFRYLGGRDNWAYEWDSDSRIPRAVRITLTVEPDLRHAGGGVRGEPLTVTTTVWLRQWFPTGQRNAEGGSA